MKKIYALSMLAVAAMAASVSCTKEIAEVPDGGIKVTVTADAVSMPGTKTELSGATKVVWQATDKVGFINGEAGVNVESSAASIDGNGKATFTGTVPAAGTYYAYYPYYNDASYAPDAEGVTVRTSKTQKPTPTSCDPASDLLVSDAFEATAGSYDAALLTFTRLGAFIRVKFTDGTTAGKLSGVYANSVAIEGENNLVGRFKISKDGLNGPITGYKEVTAEYDPDTYELVNADQAAYFGVAPQVLANASTLKVTVDSDEYIIEKTLTMPKAITLAGGDLLPINITLTDDDITVKPKATKIEKVWEILSTSSAAWTTTLSADGVTGAAGADFNIAVDDKYVYIPEFGSTKNIWAISTADKNDVKLVNNSSIESVGFDGSFFLSCARVVAKKDGTPVLLASNLFQDSDRENPTGRLYVWENGIDTAPKAVTLQQWAAGRRLGDTFTTYGNYEDCWMIFGSHPGNGFVTFKVPASAGTSASLISRLAVDLTNFAQYYPFPGEITRGMFGWRGGDHDDGTLYRNRLMSVASTEEAIKTEGAHTSTLEKLSTYMANNENNNGIGFNYTNFNGKQYAIWCMNSTDSKTFDLIVKEAETGTDWKTMIDTQGTFFRESLTGGMGTTWKAGADCQIWNTGNEVYIAINKQQVGIALYRMYTE